MTTILTDPVRTGGANREPLCCLRAARCPLGVELSLRFIDLGG